MEPGWTGVRSVPPPRLVEAESALSALVLLTAEVAGLPAAALVRLRPDGSPDEGTAEEIAQLPVPVDGRPAVVPDASAEPGTAALPVVVAGGIGAYLAVPLWGPQGLAHAVLVLYGPRPQAMPAEVVERVLRFAAVFGTALEALDEHGALENDRQRWELAVSAGGVGSFDWDLVTDRLDWDDRLMELFGFGDGRDYVPHIDSFTARLHPEDVAPTEAIIAEAIAVSGRYRAEYRVVWPDGTVRWVAARGQVTRDVDGRPVRMLGVAFDVTEAHQAATLVRRTRDRLEVLAAVSSALSGTTDARASLARLPAVIVPRLAESCIVSLGGDDGSIVDVGSHHQDPAKVATLASYCAHRHHRLDPAAWARIRRTGRMITVPYPAWETILPLLGHDTAREMLLQLRPSFVLVVPLRIRGEIVGMLTLLNDVDSGPFGSTDQQVAAEVASRAAVALDAARTFERQRRIAETLQRSLLTAPPVVEPWEIAARYLPSVDDLQVGGDWYDAFPVSDGSLVVTVGDMMGHDSSAAARMGQLRSMLRGVFLGRWTSPSVALELADEGMARYGIPGSATAIVARLRGIAGGAVDVELSVAGHPPPIVVGGSGGTRVLVVPVDPPVGVRAGRTRRSMTFRLECGETLLFYTDGLIERRDEDIDVGIERLRVVAEATGPEPEALLDAVLAGLSEHHHADDDIALLAVRCAPGAGQP